VTSSFVVVADGSETNGYEPGKAQPFTVAILRLPRFAPGVPPLPLGFVLYCTSLCFALCSLCTLERACAASSMPLVEWRVLWCAAGGERGAPSCFAHQGWRAPSPGLQYTVLRDRLIPCSMLKNILSHLLSLLLCCGVQLEVSAGRALFAHQIRQRPAAAPQVQGQPTLAGRPNVVIVLGDLFATPFLSQAKSEHPLFPLPPPASLLLPPFPLPPPPFPSLLPLPSSLPPLRAAPKSSLCWGTPLPPLCPSGARSERPSRLPPLFSLLPTCVAGIASLFVCLFALQINTFLCLKFVL